MQKHVHVRTHLGLGRVEEEEAVVDVKNGFPVVYTRTALIITSGEETTF